MHMVVFQGSYLFDSGGVGLHPVTSSNDDGTSTLARTLTGEVIA
jgi:hypothetical protein